MPSLQTALPPELANNALRLYRECLRRAKYIGHKSNLLDLKNVLKNQKKNYFTNHDIEKKEQQQRNDPLGIPYRIRTLQQNNTQLLVEMVRQQFKKHMHETDPDKIQILKDNAARGLINHMLHESENLSGRKFRKSSR